MNMRLVVMGCKGLAYIRRSTSEMRKILFLALVLPLSSRILNTQDIKE